MRPTSDNPQARSRDEDRYYLPRVRDLMTRDVLSLTEEDSVKTLRDLLREKSIRHVPITGEGDVLIGLVTHRDFLTVAVSKLAHLNPSDLDELYSNVKIRDIMGRKVNTIDPNAPLTQAASMMYEHKYGCLPVVENGRLVGIITEADFVKAFLDWDPRFKH